jgi:hypothetical protein
LHPPKRCHLLSPETVIYFPQKPSSASLKSVILSDGEAESKDLRLPLQSQLQLQLPLLLQF